MTRTQVQFPDPLYEKLKKTAARRDWSLAEILRRAAEAYLLTIDDDEQSDARKWELPVLKPSGGFLQDPASIHVEADVVVEKFTGARRG
jgi:hypothetical protein